MTFLGIAAPAHAALSRQQQIGLLNDALASFDQATELAAKEPQRAEQLYRKAAQDFEALAGAGVTSGPLYYNLGNTYLQLGRVGQAIVWYRRAQRLMPGDSRLAANLAYARNLRRNQLPTPEARALFRRVFFWHYSTSVAGRLWMAAACWVAGWITLGIRLMRPFGGLRAVAAGLIAAAIVAAASATWQMHERQARPSGVLIADDVEVYKGASENYGPQFKEALHQGVEFDLLESRADWYHIELPDGQSGWIRAASAELI